MGRVFFRQKVDISSYLRFRSQVDNSKPRIIADFQLNRRIFIQGTGAALTLSALRRKGLASQHASRVQRVGLIGAGWYGKSDLFRLIQVRDVEVIAIWDVDSIRLVEAEKLVSERQVSGKAPGHISSASCILANLSMQLGRPLTYDAKRQICAGDPEATTLLRRSYRTPWQHPYAG